MRNLKLKEKGNFTILFLTVWQFLAIAEYCPSGKRKNNFFLVAMALNKESSL